MNSKTVRFLKSLSTALVLASVVFAFLIAGIRIFGIQVFGVLTGSMEPSFPTGSLIYVKDVDASDLRVNDVITFSISPNVIATHRIVELVQDENNPSIVRFRTKGDANNDVDASLVSAGNIIGKAMFAIPHLGYVASYIQQPPGIYVAILVCALMIGFVFYTDSLEAAQKKRKRKRTTQKTSGVVTVINAVSRKILGRPLIRKKRVRKQREEESFYSGYRPPKNAQASSSVQARTPMPAQPDWAQTHSQYAPPQRDPYGYAQQAQPYPQQPYPGYGQQGGCGQYAQQPYPYQQSRQPQGRAQAPDPYGAPQYPYRQYQQPYPPQYQPPQYQPQQYQPQYQPPQYQQPYPPRRDAQRRSSDADGKNDPQMVDRYGDRRM